jgi:predicted alpha/beta-fold hydrolase
MVKAIELTAKIAGHGDRTGYYTPTFNGAFDAVDGVPDFACGVNILKFSGGAQGNGTPVHMYVDDRGDTRAVQLVSAHGLTGGMRSASLTRKFLERFQAADGQLQITGGNLQ